MHISDWYPTILEGILSHTLPSNLSLDGVNMWSSLLAGSEGPRTELLHTIDPLASHPGTCNLIGYIVCITVLNSLFLLQNPCMVASKIVANGQLENGRHNITD